MRRRLPPLLLLALFAGTMWLLAPAAALATTTAQQWAGCVLAGIGVAFALAGGIEFRRARTTVDPRDPGKTSALVSSGVYAFSRNPMYVGFVAVLAGWAVALDSLLAGLLLPVFFLWLDRVQIPAEETAIATLFGARYAEYCQRVRRWL